MSLKGAKLRRAKDRDRLLSDRAPQRLQFRAKLGDGQGTVLTDADDRRYVNVYREDRSVITGVLNMRVSNINDLPVLVGYSDEYPGTLQILSVSWGDLGWATSDRAYLVSHSEQHTFHRDGEGGDDVVFIEMEQVLDGLIFPSTPAAMTVDQRNCWYAYGTSFYYKDDEADYDLSGEVPAAGNGVWVLVYIDTTVDPHVLDHVAGTEYNKLFFPRVDMSMPDAPVGSVPLGAVFLEDTTASITWENVYSMRLFPSGVSGVMAATAHSLLDGSVHDDTVANDPPVQGDIIVANGTPEWDALPIGAADTVVKSDGADPAWGNVGHDELTDVAADDHHDPVTLGAVQIQAIFDLAAQALTLDTQSANEVLAGPALGVAAKPAFRALVAADIPTISPAQAGGHTHVINEDLTALCDGARTVFGLNNEAQPETTALFKNGSRMRLDDDYTETDLYNSVTFGVAPGGADDVWIDYIAATG